MSYILFLLLNCKRTLLEWYTAWNSWTEETSILLYWSHSCAHAPPPQSFASTRKVYSNPWLGNAGTCSVKSSTKLKITAKTNMNTLDIHHGTRGQKFIWLHSLCISGIDKIQPMWAHLEMCVHQAEIGVHKCSSVRMSASRPACVCIFCLCMLVIRVGSYQCSLSSSLVRICFSVFSTSRCTDSGTGSDSV